MTLVVMNTYDRISLYVVEMSLRISLYCGYAIRVQTATEIGEVTIATLSGYLVENSTHR